ncbi:hypothetical protein DCI86_11230 [Salmonella enterica subsp. enterica serovar Typhimurium]|nr:hypothetical protein [Salmonella enterica subsp. enterica serovar Typhimurium]
MFFARFLLFTRGGARKFSTGRKLSSATLKVLNKLVSGETLDKAINQSLTLKSDVIMVEKCIFFNRLDSIF